MSSRPFCHLHCHSHYSLLDGANKLPDLVKHVKASGMSAVAVTDHGNLFGAVEFLREAKYAGIKPIVGIEAYVAPGKRSDRSTNGSGDEKFAYHLTLLAKNGVGFRNLLRLSSRSYQEGYYYKPRVDKELLARYSEGLICLSGCVGSEFSQHLLRDRFEQAENLAIWYQKTFGEGNFYIEIQDNGLQIQRDARERQVDVARKLGMPIVATSDAHYLRQDDNLSHDVLLCINTGKTIDQPLDKPRFINDEGRISDQFHVRSPDEMYAAAPGFEEALKQSALIAEMVEENYTSAELGKRQFPSFQPPDEKSPEAYLLELCEQGLRERYPDPPPPEVRARLDHELGTINRMGFASYFLIVWDFVRYARENNIPALARGSACGALVSYVLRLSDVCPIKYDLLFERFLDPNRSEAPDIDIDLCQERRYEVIEYVRRKYGDANVAQIGTFGTMKAKAAIKDVGRAMNLPLSRVEEINKLIPTRLNITLDEAIVEEPALKRMAEQDPEIQRLLDFARRLEGSARNASTHAAGVVIADQPLESLVPLQVIRRGDKEEVLCTQWGMGDVEKAGLLKMDFLGLRNLTTLQAAVRIIGERFPDNPLDIGSLPLDDAKAFELLQRGETKGVFQLESAGIRDLLVKMKPDRFADIIATNALYRPGPLNGGMVDEYVDVKNKRKQASYLHPVLQDVLEETYGVMVYQEQVMRILNRLGDIELSKAYACIKAISKKKTEIIAEGRGQFIKGAVEKGLERDKAARIFELIEFFGGYGFNKSHSTAYALVAYQTAYLKSHYPTEYMAAVLSSEMGGAERDKFFVEHIEDCRRMGIEVLPPNINQGGATFTVHTEGKVEFGLEAIKGVGGKAVEAILKARDKDGPFLSLEDFFERVSIKEVGAGAAETLIRAGAFDFLGARRSQLLSILPRAMQAGQSKQEDRKRGQRGLFDEVDVPGDGASSGAAPVAHLPDIPELPDVELLGGEKKALGFYMSNHPLSRHADKLQALATHRAADMADAPSKSEVTLGGMITNVQVRNVQKSRSGLTRMAKFTFEDLSGSTPAMLWPEEFAKLGDLIANDAIGFIKGTIDRRREPAEIVVSRFIPIENADAELARGVIITLHKGVQQQEDLERLLRIVRVRPGNLDLYLEIFGIEHVRRVIYRAGSSLKVRFDDRMVSEMGQVVGVGNVRLLGARGATARADASSAAPARAPVAVAVMAGADAMDDMNDSDDD
ncbi:DNA polymerase III subunit alpha [Planctomyces sp. SH-PL62]|uniref:DNA polymerase III subunit alpha n=1 Tax=Planctomyces sp. SH-PL62 TaxID=1636152 RepID=UPI00078D2363|nr:DNA polymerase III subunit alpha [Planctomyces sp. SH-PL62]AMV36522.1 DNA polymerase III subunit alpha [Planctomyces sp. SH-PL62]